MPVPSLVTDLSTTAASNSPAGSENVFPSLDDYLRAQSAFLASIRDNSGNGWVSPYLPLAGGTVTGATTFSGAVSYTGTLTGGTGVVNLGSGQFYKSATGDVGIGTNAPVATLDVNGAARFRSDLYVYGTGDRLNVFPASAGNGVSVISTNNGNTAYSTLKLDGAPLIFNYAGGEVGRFNSSGNLGIGTSSPVTKLDVNGFVRIRGASQLQFFNADNTSGASIQNLGVTSTDALTFNTTGSERMRLDSSGNVGLGVTPSANAYGSTKTFFISGDSTNGLLALSEESISSTSQYVSLMNNAYPDGAGVYKYKISSQTATSYRQNDGAHRWFTAPPGTAGNAISFTQAMTLDASGNLLVGTTTNAENYKENLQFSGASVNGLYVKNTASTGGPIFIAAIDSAQTLNNTTQAITYTDSTAERFSVRKNGGIANYSANDVALSDRREKTNFAPAKDYLDTICAIPVQTFNYIDQSEDDPGLTLGVVAQDVQAVAPELVTESNWGTEDDPKMRLSIYQTDLQYALMKCIQEQQTLITDLRARVAALEA